jgi:outer membrane protein insertion porin family
MLAAACGFAQGRAAQKTAPAAAATAKWPIENINVEGIHHYTREQVLAASGLKIGQLAGRPEFEAARDRLLATGVFETVGYKFAAAGTAKGYVATFQVTEVEQAYPVRFEDLHVSELEAEKALKAKDPLFSLERLAATQPVLERHARWLQEFMAGKGIKEKVTASVTLANPGEYMVVFHPDRPLPAVAYVRFRGNQVLSENVLWDAVSSSAVGMPFTEDSFREMLYTALRPLYEARGRVRLAFPELRAEPAKDVQGLTVTVTVDEGESYTLGKVTIADATPVSAGELLQAGDFKTGDVANFDLVNAGVERIRKTLRRAGYIQAQVMTTRKLDNEKKAVDLAVHVDAGPQFVMGKLILVGLELEGEAEIKRMWNLKDGKPFNPEYPDKFLASVREQDIFDRLGKTKSDPKVDEKSHIVDVTLTFGTAPAPPPKKTGRGGRGYYGGGPSDKLSESTPLSY